MKTIDKLFFVNYNLMFFRIRLELLSQDEVELAAAVACGAEDLVEAVSPVDTHHTDHRQEDSDTHSCRAFQVEGVELLEVAPGVSCLHKCQCVDVGGVLQHQGVAQLCSHACVFVVIGVVCERTVVATSQTDGLLVVA